MKRQLRASGQQVAPLGDYAYDEGEGGTEEEQGLEARKNGGRDRDAYEAGTGQPRKARNNSSRRRRRTSSSSGSSEDPDDDDDISAFLLAIRAHSTRLTRLNDHVESLVTRGKEAVVRVAAMQEGGRGRVWGVLELGEREQDEEEEEEHHVKGDDVDSIEGEPGIGATVELAQEPNPYSESDEVDSGFGGAGLRSGGLVENERREER
ncbi:hypothetical protein QFC24_002139 [Naganishia onofrii]|uniref:Uncharacterized protein n=1 Tax=Naganishia onofrii TaxID=1851511 RepID=A0ACC2XTR1_9TREE|nr:hypothetical protein QFC24_002139 [Naganishia onofrii]